MWGGVTERLPTTRHALGWLRGRGGPADTGRGALHSPQEDAVLGKMCPQRTIWLPSALSLWTRGRGKLPEGTLLGAPAPPTADSRLAALGRAGAFSSRLGSCAALGEVGFKGDGLGTLPPATLPLGRAGEEFSHLRRASSPEAADPQAAGEIGELGGWG